MPEENHTPTNGVSPASEDFGSPPHPTSESFGNVPNASESNGQSFRKASETFRSNTPPASETIDEILSRPERLSLHTLTAREVEKLFEQAGRPVTERSILNWCKPNGEGICRLNCGYERGERRWYIAPDSVERVIEEERRKDQSFPKESLEFSEASDRLSESFGKGGDFASESFGNVRKEDAYRFGNVPNASERTDASFPKASAAYGDEVPHTAPAVEPLGPERSQANEEQKKVTENLQKRVVELERELASETAANRWKDDLITSARERVEEFRNDYQERVKFYQTQIEKLQFTNERYVEQLVGINRMVGELEAENRVLRQLPPPGTSRADNPEDDGQPPPASVPHDAFDAARAIHVIHD
jgi:hypothetical protein